MKQASLQRSRLFIRAIAEQGRVARRSAYGLNVGRLREGSQGADSSREGALNRAPENALASPLLVALENNPLWKGQ